MKPDDKGVFSGELVLDGSKDPKLSYWIRYLVGRAGGNRWYPANLLRLATAVDRKAITIKYEPPLNKSDALALTSDAAFRIRVAGSNDAALGMTLKGTLQEKVTDKTSDGKWHKRLTYDSLEALPTEDKKPLEGAEKLVKLLKDATLLASEIDVGNDGAIIRYLIDNSKVPKASREALNDLVVDQAQQSIDSLSVPLPGKEVSPMDTWKGNQTYMLGALGYMVPVKAELTYKFEGVFMREDKPVAVITFEGPIQSDFSSKPKKGTKPPTVTGKVDGKIEVSTDTGLIQYGTEKIRAEVSTETRDDKPVKASGTLNVTLRRNPPAAPKKK